MPEKIQGKEKAMKKIRRKGAGRKRKIDNKEKNKIIEFAKEHGKVTIKDIDVQYFKISSP